MPHHFKIEIYTYCLNVDDTQIYLSNPALSPELLVDAQ